jgi:transcriptional regulator with XRE-family HTH domain
MLGLRLRELRIAHAGSASAMARELGVREGTYRSYELRGIAPWPAIERIVEITKCNLVWLLCGAGKMDDPQDAATLAAINKAKAEHGKLSLEQVLSAIGGSLARRLVGEGELVQVLKDWEPILPVLATVDCVEWKWLQLPAVVRFPVPPRLYRRGRFVLDIAQILGDAELRPGDRCIFDAASHPPFAGQVVALQLVGDPNVGTVQRLIAEGEEFRLLPGEKGNKTNRFRWATKPGSKGGGRLSDLEVSLMESVLKSSMELSEVGGQRRFTVRGIQVALIREYRTYEEIIEVAIHEARRRLAGRPRKGRSKGD